jgi:hypothetical protein
MRALVGFALLTAACGSTPDELVFDCGMGGGLESWFRCEYIEQRQCFCGDGTTRGAALVCVPGNHGEWGLAADRVIRERGMPIAVVRCERVSGGPGRSGGLPDPTIIVGASVGATGGDWPASEPQAGDDCSCD